MSSPFADTRVDTSSATTEHIDHSQQSESSESSKSEEEKSRFMKFRAQKSSHDFDGVLAILDKPNEQDH